MFCKQFCNQTFMYKILMNHTENEIKDPEDIQIRARVAESSPSLSVFPINLLDPVIRLTWVMCGLHAWPTWKLKCSFKTPCLYHFLHKCSIFFFFFSLLFCFFKFSQGLYLLFIMRYHDRNWLFSLSRLHITSLRSPQLCAKTITISNSIICVFFYIVALTNFP